MKLVVGELKGEQKSLSEMIKTSDQKFEERFTKIGQSRKDFDKEIREQVAQCMKEFGVVKEKLAALDEKSKGLEEKSKGLDEKLKTAEVKKPSGDAR
jgi:chromosome segregation ATPase